jgi:hypothetical protein
MYSTMPAVVRRSSRAASATDDAGEAVSLTESRAPLLTVSSFRSA